MILGSIFNGAPKWVFLFLAFSGLALVLPLLLLINIIACVYPCHCGHRCKKYCAKETLSTGTERSPCIKKCGGCLRTLLNWGSRKMNVIMFPGLFKEHKAQYKDRSNSRTATRVSILFLDRTVENNFAILFNFFLLASAIFTSALILFFRHIPVAISSECLKRDDELRNLFCYTNGSTLPVDCDTYNSTELEELEFVCYAISILELGIAIAAVLALAKIATVCITIYIRVSEAVYMWSRDNTSRYCRLSAKCIYLTYYVATFAVLEFLAVVYSVVVELYIIDRGAEGVQSSFAYLAYGFLPTMLMPFLIAVLRVRTFGKHCDQEEYISYSSDQLPSCVNDCDVYEESGNDRDGLEDLSFHSKTTIVEYVDPRPVVFVVSTEQAGRERRNDNSAAPNDMDSGLIINNTSYLTPLLQDHLTTQISPQTPDSQA